MMDGPSGVAVCTDLGRAESLGPSPWGVPRRAPASRTIDWHEGGRHGGGGGAAGPALVRMRISSGCALVQGRGNGNTDEWVGDDSECKPRAA